MNAEQQVYGLLEQHFPGRVYRTKEACAAAITAEREAERAAQARRHPGDVRRGLAPLEGAAADVARATPVRWRITDEIARLLALCRAVQAGGAADSTLSPEEAIAGAWALQRVRDRAGSQWGAAWWAAQAGVATADVLVALQGDDDDTSGRGPGDDVLCALWGF